MQKIGHCATVSLPLIAPNSPGSLVWFDFPSELVWPPDRAGLCVFAPFGRLKGVRGDWTTLMSSPREEARAQETQGRVTCPDEERVDIGSHDDPAWHQDCAEHHALETSTRLYSVARWSRTHLRPWSSCHDFMERLIPGIAQSQSRLAGMSSLGAVSPSWAG
jgi:hypothetical protein